MTNATFAIVLDRANARLAGNKARVKQLHGIFRARAIADKETYLNGIADEVEEWHKNGHLRVTYRAIKRISFSRSLSRAVAINRADGQPVRGEKETLDRWREHYVLMLNHPPANLCGELDNLSYTPENRSINTSCPSLAEVRTTIRRFHSGRAAGPDKFSPEMLKAALNPVSVSLHALIKRVWKNCLVPTEWRDGIIVSLYKGKGSGAECGSYRPITLVSVPGKVFSHMILARLKILIDRHQHPQQSRFTEGRSTLDSILSIHFLSEVDREFAQPLHSVYVDLKDAFDYLDRDALWKAMQGTPLKIRDLLRA